MVKPTVSWTGAVSVRAVPVEVMNEAEAMEATTGFLATGCEVLARQLATGRREGVSLFIVNGELLAYTAGIVKKQWDNRKQWREDQQ